MFGKTRLNNRSAAVALAEGERVIFFRNQKSLLLQIRQHSLACFITIESRIRARILIHVGMLVHHINLRQVVPLSRLEIIRIMRRRYFYRTRAELRLRQIIGDDWNFPLHQRQQNTLAVQMRVALIVFINSDSHIT